MSKETIMELELDSFKVNFAENLIEIGHEGETSVLAVMSDEGMKMLQKIEKKFSPDYKDDISLIFNFKIPKPRVKIINTEGFFFAKTTVEVF